MKTVAREPKRFKVRFRTLEGADCDHAVVTWMDAPKAVAMAAVNHTYHHKDLGIYEVVVEDAKWIDRDADGVYRLEDDDVTDRMEW
jgi:hypothetical protein